MWVEASPTHTPHPTHGDSHITGERYQASHLQRKGGSERRWAGEFYVNLTQAQVLWEEQTLVEKMPLPDWPVACLWEDTAH